jgi:hypothetical protein
MDRKLPIEMWSKIHRMCFDWQGRRALEALFFGGVLIPGPLKNPFPKDSWPAPGPAMGGWSYGWTWRLPNAKMEYSKCNYSDDLLLEEVTIRHRESHEEWPELPDVSWRKESDHWCGGYPSCGMCEERIELEYEKYLASQPV